MKTSELKPVAFFSALLLSTVICVVVWDSAVAGNIYQCTDSVPGAYLLPGHGYHPWYGDTLKPGWSAVGLWCLWGSMALASLLFSVLVASMRWGKSVKDA
jgi:hypothetical protein